MSVEKTMVMVITRQPSPVRSMVDQKQPDSVECITHVDILITCDARCAHAIKYSIAVTQGIFNKKNNLVTSKLNFKTRKKLTKCYTWNTDLYAAETLTLRKIYQKCLESCAVWCWRRMEKVSWTGRARSHLFEYVVWKRPWTGNWLDLSKTDPGCVASNKGKIVHYVKYGFYFNVLVFSHIRRGTKGNVSLCLFSRWRIDSGSHILRNKIKIQFIKLNCKWQAICFQFLICHLRSKKHSSAKTRPRRPREGVEV